MPFFQQLMNKLAKMKNEIIDLTRNISSNDDKIILLTSNLDEILESCVDICNNPNKEIQIPLTKIFTEKIFNENDYENKEEDILLKNVEEKFIENKYLFEESCKKFSESIKDYRKSLLKIKDEITKINDNSCNSYEDYKNYINNLFISTLILIKGLNVKNFRKNKNIVNDSSKFNDLKVSINELGEIYDKYYPQLNTFNNDSYSIFSNEVKLIENISNLIEKKIIKKVIDVLSKINDGIISLKETAIKIKEYDVKNKERKNFYDNSLNQIIKLIKKINEIKTQNENNIKNDFNELNSNIKNYINLIKKKKLFIK